MNERELSKLCYLGLALARSPDHWRSSLRLLRHPGLVPLSAEMQLGLRGLARKLGRKRATKKDMRRAATALLRSRSDAEHAVGRALAWGLEQTCSCPRCRPRRP